MFTKKISLLLALMLLACALLPACSNVQGVGGSDDTTGAIDAIVDTPFSRGEVGLACSSSVFPDIEKSPFPTETYISDTAPKTRHLTVESITYELVYRDSCPGQYMDCDLDRYTMSGAKDLAVWFKAGTDQVVSLELGVSRDATRDGEVILKIRAKKLLAEICGFDLDIMEESYTYIPKVEAQHERLVTIKYEIAREDGRSYHYAEVDFHINMISVILYQEPEPSDDVMNELLAASDLLDSHLVFGRGENTPAIKDVSQDDAPVVYQKDGKWVLETKRTVTYALGRNDMTRTLTFYIWIEE